MPTVSQEEFVAAFGDFLSEKDLADLVETLKAVSMPHWAEKTLDGEYALHAQLSTRDGRRMGNAVIVAVDYREDKYFCGNVYTILTDFGNELRLVEGELEELFHEPKWQMKAVNVQRRLEHMQGYVE